LGHGAASDFLIFFGDALASPAIMIGGDRAGL